VATLEPTSINARRPVAKMLMEGNEAIAEAAIRAGCDCYFGYPITPQTQLLEYMSKRMPELGRVFVQAESEIAAINMVFGAAATGKRAMTSSSSPGMSLKQEGISYISAAELPAVIVNMMRGGPGLGGIGPAQGDYFQATRPGHGDYHSIVLAPASVQEAIDLTVLAFDLADRYRTPVILLGDGLIGQMMEPVVLPEIEPTHYDKPWALTGALGRPRRLVTSLELDSRLLAKRNRGLQAKYELIRANEQRHVISGPKDAAVLAVAYGISSRIVHSGIQLAQNAGVKAAMFRPITAFPFPYAALQESARRVKAILVVELSSGQMLEDVRLSAQCVCPIHFHGTMGGELPTPEEIAERLIALERGLN
jgi:2-oxoglutarate/2-oxoacid ferredoxin oxidoreductase subunit alpha